MSYLSKLRLKIANLCVLLFFFSSAYAANTAPQLQPIPGEIIMLGQAVVIQPQVINTEQDPIQFSLRYAPPSATINSQTGVFTWRPSTVGIFRIAMVVEETNQAEGENLKAEQLFYVTVISRQLIEFGLSQIDIEQLDSAIVPALPPELFSVFNDLDIQQLPADTFSTILPEQFAQFTASAICGLTEDQFSLLPADYLGYLNAQSMTGFTPNIIQMFRTNHLETLANTEEIKRIPSHTVSSILTNLDAQQVLPQEVEQLLPENWTLDRETGKLSAPVGSFLTFKALHLDRKISKKTELPYDVPNLNTHFALGGESDDSVVSDLNELLAQNQLSHLQLSQTNAGVVSVKGMQDGVEVEYAMMPDPRHIVQKAQTETSGLNISLNNGLELVTSQKQAFAMLPAPKNLMELEMLVGEQGSIKVDKNGEVLLRYFDEDSQSYRRSFVTFDYIVQKPTTRNQRARIELPPRDVKNTRAIREGRVVYSDGSVQNIYPTVLYPEILVSLLYGISGVENAIYNVDGSFSINLSGTQLSLLPLDGFINQSLDAGQIIEPSINLQSETFLTYTVQDHEQALTFSLQISL